MGSDRDLQRTMHFCISAGRTLLHLDPHRHPKAKGLFNRDNSQLTVKPLACLILATARMCSKLRAYQIVKREGGQLQIGQIGPLPLCIMRSHDDGKRFDSKGRHASQRETRFATSVVRPASERAYVHYVRPRNAADRVRLKSSPQVA